MEKSSPSIYRDVHAVVDKMQIVALFGNFNNDYFCIIILFSKSLYSPAFFYSWKDFRKSMTSHIVIFISSSTWKCTYEVEAMLRILNM